MSYWHSDDSIGGRELQRAMRQEFQMQAAREATRIISDFFIALSIISRPSPTNPFRPPIEWELERDSWPMKRLHEGLGDP